MNNQRFTRNNKWMFRHFAKTTIFQQFSKVDFPPTILVSFKKHKVFVFNIDTPTASHLCEIYENLIFLTKSMSPKSNLSIHSINIHSLVEGHVCDSSSKSCMYSTSDKCCDTGLKVENFKDQRSNFINGNGLTKKFKKPNLFCRLTI